MYAPKKKKKYFLGAFEMFGLQLEKSLIAIQIAFIGWFAFERRFFIETMKLRNKKGDFILNILFKSTIYNKVAEFLSF